MKKIIILSFLILFPILNSCAQSQAVNPLQIGDVMPDLTINNIINYKTDSAKISYFEGKVLILDFFATWCSSCIAELPKLDILQKQFNDSIQIFVVAYEKPNKIESFLENNPIGKTVSLSFITEDSVLNKFFPHKLIPHEVWIDETGRVAAITQANYVTAKNLQELMAGKPLHLPIKRDIMDFDRNKPLLENGNGGNEDNILYRSTWIKHLDGIFSGGGINTNKDSALKRIYYINTPILMLYNSILEDALGNRIILEVKDSSRYIDNNTNKAWSSENEYCYELSVPISLPKEQIQQIMLQDINRYLGLSGRMEKRLVKCWALQFTKKTDSALRSTGGKPEMRLYGKENQVKLIRNEPISRLIDAMNYQLMGKPIKPVIIDETHYSGNIDLKLKVDDIQDIPAMRKALQSYGLDLVPVERELEMFVITENTILKN